MSDKKYLGNHVIDITGQRFGKLTAVKFYGTEFGRALWVFKCDCGKESIAYTQHVKTGQTKSCGCNRKTNHYVSKRYDFNPKKDHLYRVWAIKRFECRNGKRDKERQKAEFYDGWNDHKVFRKWAFENGYDEETGRISLVRVDRQRGYTPDNCVFVTTNEAMSRRRS